VVVRHSRGSSELDRAVGPVGMVVVDHAEDNHQSFGMANKPADIPDPMLG